MSHQDHLNQWLESLPEGAEFQIPGRKGWQTVHRKVGGGFDLVHMNPTEDGSNTKFFVYTSLNTPWGNGLMAKEASFAIPVNTIQGLEENNGVIVDVLVANQENTEIDHRYSLTNAASKDLAVSVAPDGSVHLAGGHVGWVHTLLEADKNRMVGLKPGTLNSPEYVPGYELFCTKEKPPQIQIHEMETIVLAS